MSTEQITKFIINSDQQLVQLRAKIISGNKDLLNNLIQAFNNLLLNSAWHEKVYYEINQLCVTAQPQIIMQLNNEVFPKVAERHKAGDLDNYIIFWKRLFPGTGPRIDYPNVNKTLSVLHLNAENRQLQSKFAKDNIQFEKNMGILQQKRVQFFEDFEDSFVTESMDDEMVSEIIEMDIQQIKQIREIVQAGPIQEVRAEQYLKKMYNFVELKPRTLSKQLSQQFNKQKIWARQYIDNYSQFVSNGSCYLNKYFSNPNQERKNTRKKPPSSSGNQQIMLKNTSIGNMTQSNIPLTAEQYHNSQNSNLFKYKQKRTLQQKQSLDYNGSANVGRQMIKQDNNNGTESVVNYSKKQNQNGQVIYQKGSTNYQQQQVNYGQRQGMEHNIIDKFTKTLPTNKKNENHIPNKNEHQKKNIQNYESFGKTDNHNNMGSNSRASYYERDSIEHVQRRSRIFGDKSASRISKKMYNNQDHEDLVVIKHGHKNQPGQFILDSNNNNNRYKQTSNKNYPYPSYEDKNEGHLSNTAYNKAVSNNTAHKNNTNNKQPQFIMNEDGFPMNIGRSTFPSAGTGINMGAYIGNKQNNDNNMHINQKSANITTPNNHNKISYNNASQYSQYTPGTAFPNRTGFTSSSKKLSQFNQEKNIRKIGAPLDHLTHTEDYILRPYSQHFHELPNFNRFRRNCLEDGFTLYASSFMVVTCAILKQANSKLKLEITYSNQSSYQLAVQTIYRIPKCFKIEKNSKIAKKFVLSSQITHVFSLQMVLFPLQSCLLNLKYKIEVDLYGLNQQNPTVVPLPVTMRNFLQFLMISQQQWKRSWVKLTQSQQNFRISRHIILDKNVLNDDQLEVGLKQFVHVGSVEGYSADQFGALCRHISYHKMIFLLRISVRVDNILTIQIVSDRKIQQQDEADFLEYCLSMWGMLLCRIEENSII